MILVRNLIAIIAALISSSALASPAQYSKDSVTDTLGIFTALFEGQISFSKICFGVPINLECSLSSEVDFFQSTSSANEVIFSMKSFEMTGGGSIIQCGDYYTESLPWDASILHDNLPASSLDSSPVEFTINGVELVTFCGTCSGSISATFSNTDNGDITLVTASPMSGGCSMHGTATSLNHEYRIWH